MSRVDRLRNLLRVILLSILVSAISIAFVCCRSFDLRHVMISSGQRLEAISQIENDSGFVSFRNKNGGISMPVDDEVRRRDRVECIYLAGSELDEKTLTLLPALQEAKFISFNSSAFSDRHISCLDPLVNLTEMQLNGTRITDDGLKRLLHAHPLEALTLNDTVVTDGSVNVLATMKSLRKLQLFNTYLTDAAVSRLKSSLPGCEIAYAPIPEGRQPVAALPRKRIKTVLKPDLSGPVVTLGPIPTVTLQEIPATAHEETEQIKSYIRGLADIDSPDFGLSPSITGHAFLPIPGRTTVAMVLFTNHNLSSSEALRELVKRGPKAMPLLLEALDDRTPTKLTIHSSFGGLWFERELRGNPVNKKEQDVLQSRPKPKDRFQEHNEQSYVVKVGDACFVAIGQIVGRHYQAVRYQPSGCIYVNSPPRDPHFCQEVRTMWSSHDPRRDLFESLLRDYSTQGIFNGESLDGWSLGSHLQIEAALRLLYYFPTETAPLIAERLDSLKVHQIPVPDTPSANNDRLSALMMREVANGIDTNEFIEAVLWSDHPLIKAAIEDIKKRTDDSEIRELIEKASKRAEGLDRDNAGI